jgi:hypothetical protein
MTTLTAWPRLSWKTVPMYWYGADPSARFDDETIEYAASFPVVVPNGNHMRWVEPAEQQQETKLVQTASRLKQSNNGCSILFYLNSMMDWTQYSLHHSLAASYTERWNVNQRGDVVCLRSQPIFNFSLPEMREMWLDTMTTALDTGKPNSEPCQLISGTEWD